MQETWTLGLARNDRDGAFFMLNAIVTPEDVNNSVLSVKEQRGC